MHAVVVNVTINDRAAAESELRDQLVPWASQTPGFVTGYWTIKGACGSPESVTGSKHSAAVALIPRAGISPGPLIPSATDDEHELPTGSRCLEWLPLAADIAAYPDRARDVSPSRI